MNNKEIKFKNIGKRKIEFVLITGKITIYRTILRIEDNVNLDDYNLKSKYIIPFDEYLGIDNLPFKISIKAMIKFAFWGQNQSSFQKASNIIKELYNIQISYVTIKDVTEYVGNLLFNNLVDNANKIWDNRANIDIKTSIKKGTLYIQIDGAAVNTRIEDENGSTWKENKLGIFFF